MIRVLGRYSEQAYALMRLMAGAMFSLHGFQKLFGLWGRSEPVVLASQMGLAGIIELVGGIMIAIGLFAGPAAFIASGTMAVAYFQGHALKNGFELLPIVNKGELAALYCFVFLFIATRGSGIWSVDSLLHKGKKT